MPDARMFFVTPLHALFGHFARWQDLYQIRFVHDSPNGGLIPGPSGDRFELPKETGGEASYEGWVDGWVQRNI